MLSTLLPADVADLAGTAAAVVAGVLLWVLAARLRVSPASRAAVVALYAVAVLAVNLGSGPAVDGSGLLLLVAGATFAVGSGRARTLLATALLVAAVAATPVTAVGSLVLGAGMALRGELGRRLGLAGRAGIAAAGCAGAVAVAVALSRPDEPAALPVGAPAGLSVWTVLIVGLLWRRLPWLRPVAAAVLALLCCAWVPGPDADATLLVAAAVALLTAVVAEDTGRLLVRRALGVAAVAAVGAGTVWLAPASAAPGPDQHTVSAAPARSASRPVSVTIPAIGVSSTLEDLVADPRTGELAAPADPARAGWFAAGVVPGDQGPAVLGGHVDSRRGPGVFFRLRDLRPGDRVLVTRSDGVALTFTVIAVQAFPKTAFPTAAVYGPTAGPELRLVTCGGRFDRSARSYDDNVVVDAALA